MCWKCNYRRFSWSGFVWIALLFPDLIGAIQIWYELSSVLFLFVDCLVLVSRNVLLFYLNLLNCVWILVNCLSWSTVCSWSLVWFSNISRIMSEDMHLDLLICMQSFYQFEVTGVHFVSNQLNEELKYFEYVNWWIVVGGETVHCGSCINRFDFYWTYQ